MEPPKEGPCLDAVRALHQTVVALRVALEQSRSEILELKAKAWPVDAVEEALRNLAIENHVLRSRLLDRPPETGAESPDKDGAVVGDAAEDRLEPESRPEAPIPRPAVGEATGTQPEAAPTEAPEETTPPPATDTPRKATVKTNKKPKPRGRRFEAKISIRAHSKVSASLESLTALRSPRPRKRLSVAKTVSVSNLSTAVDRNISFDMNGDSREPPPQSPQSDLDPDQEVDDIELIFTTDDTKESDFKEQLVSIEAGDSATLLHCPPSDPNENLDASDRELDDDVFNNDNFENENQENSNFQAFDCRRENSQLYNSKSDNSINHEEKSLKSCYSYQDSSFENKSLEKDESFDRFDERVRIVETDISKCGIQDVDYGGGRRYTCPNPLQYRPLLHREALSKLNSRKTRPILAHSNAMRKDSEAQTDISALPGSAWLSESNLVNNKTRLGENFPTLPSKFPMPGSRLRPSEKTVEARRVLLSDIGFTSMVPELSRSADHLFAGTGTPKPPVVTTYGQFLKTTDYQSPAFTSQRFTWTTTTATPSDGGFSHSGYSSMYPMVSPPAPSRRCSAPVSPSRRALLRPAASKVRFANGSLPELRGDWSLTVDSGDSTDSLVEEAEDYLRRSIDCILTTRDSYGDSKKSGPRRASAPEPSGDNVPPPGWLPFLPRMPRDLKPDHWVKVITPEGRVRGGRVRYVGPVVSQTDQFVGVQLASPDGHSDGTFSSRRYFQCEPYHGIFVPFKKVIMGWRP